MILSKRQSKQNFILFITFNMIFSFVHIYLYKNVIYILKKQYNMVLYSIIILTKYVDEMKFIS